MENMGVRFIPTDQYKGKWTGNKPSLCFGDEKAKKGLCVVIRETEIGTVDLPFDVIEKSPMVEYPQGSGLPYPPARFISFIAGIAKPITDEARVLMDSITKKKGKKLPPNKPKPSPTSKTKPVLKTAGAELIITLAAEWKLPPPKLRRFLRSQGLRAPYVDEALVRKTLKTLKKAKK